MAEPDIRANLIKLKREIEATIAAIDVELSASRPALKLLVPRNDISRRCFLTGNKDVLVFIQTLIEKIFYIKPEPDEDEENLEYFNDQLEKSITLIGENISNVKSLHPAIGIPEVTNEQYIQMTGRQEMFNHFKDILKDFGL
ncbi:MAG: hypothetical protein M0P26_01070 [Bacteroidales bacterium]|nr:hypothetical protein [Bacteroidales bacterium]